jgi:glycosyltransferase involved in cell wall biosynthesis
MRPDVTVIVPTWNAENFIQETLSSIASQTYKEIRVIVSIDPSDDRTADICKKFATNDRRFKVYNNRRRKGWAENFNHALKKVRTSYFINMPHDDLIPSNYISLLYQAILNKPSALCVFPDIKTFQNREESVNIHSIVGENTAQRAINWIESSLGAIPFRGLTKSLVLKKGLRLHTGKYDSYFADRLWVTHLAILGNCFRVPEAIYRKRIRDGSVVRGWEAWDETKKTRATIEFMSHAKKLLKNLPLSREDKISIMEAMIRQWENAPTVWKPYNEHTKNRFISNLILTIDD